MVTDLAKKNITAIIAIYHQHQCSRLNAMSHQGFPHSDDFTTRFLPSANDDVTDNDDVHALPWRPASREQHDVTTGTRLYKYHGDIHGEFLSMGSKTSHIFFSMTSSKPKQLGWIGGTHYLELSYCICNHLASYSGCTAAPGPLDAPR